MTDAPHRDGSAMTTVRSAWRAVRDFWTVQVELQERLAVLNRPWEQDLLHWSGGELHGRVPPPADGRRRSVTAGGWCPCAHGLPRGLSRPCCAPGRRRTRATPRPAG